MTKTVIVKQSLLMDPTRFDQAQRVGNMMALSPLFPEHLRKGGNNVALANAVLVQDMADRLSRPPLEVAQNIYFVSGKPGWSTSYLIGLANESGKLKESINWEVKGKGDSLEVRAFAKLTSGAKIEYTVSMEMAKAEGWTKNPKYRSLPELMLRYRSATALIRLFLPEITMGVPSQEEVLDEPTMRDITPQTSSAPADTGSMVAEEEIPEAEVEDVTPEPEKKAPAQKSAAKDKPKPEPEKAKYEAKTETTEDGTVHDADTGEVQEDDNAAPEKDPEDVERHAQLKDMILSEIGACDDLGMLEDVLGMYGPQIEQIGGFDADMAEEITTATDERRKEISE